MKHLVSHARASRVSASKRLLPRGQICYPPCVEVSTAKQVRFAKLVEAGGTPKTYLPFGDIEKDTTFMRAVKEHRVVTIKQEPTSKQKDFGVVDFLKEKYVTYLVFPKSIDQFSGQRVVGIKYDLLASAEVVAFGAPQKLTKPAPKREPPPKEKPKVEEPKVELAVEEKPKPPPPPKKEKPKPQPKRFNVHVRITSVEDKDVEVTAWNAAEAKIKARDQIEASSTFDADRMKAKVVSAHPVR
jgi:hypothetical protein